jgi:hypothetical protein
MPQDHFADNFVGDTGPGGIGGGIPAKIVRPQRNAVRFFRPWLPHPCCLMGTWKYAILVGLTAFTGIFPEPVGNLLGKKHHLMFPATFRPPQR